MLEQQTNAYAVLPESQWRGYSPPQEPPAPAPGTWGEPTPMPSVLAQAAQESELVAVVRVLATDPKDQLAAALARLGRAFMARELVSFTGLHEMRRTKHTGNSARYAACLQGAQVLVVEGRLLLNRRQWAGWCHMTATA